MGEGSVPSVLTRLPRRAWAALLVDEAAVIAVLARVGVGVALIAEPSRHLVIQEALDLVLPRRSAPEQPRAQGRVPARSTQHTSQY